MKTGTIKGWKREHGYMISESEPRWRNILSQCVVGVSHNSGRWEVVTTCGILPDRPVKLLHQGMDKGKALRFASKWMRKHPKG